MALASVAVLAACAGSGSRAAANGSAETAERKDPNVITAAEMIASNFNTAFDAVQALHPNWLRPRGQDSFGNPSQVLVYIDNMRLGTVVTLRTLDLRSIRYLRYFDGPSATSRWGTGHAGGVILASTRP
jgi:hypothetical protein